MSDAPGAQADSTPPLTLTIQNIMDFLPHRYPFLLVDRITALVPHKYVDAYKNVTMNEPFFQGHFPGLPVMPGVLIMEALAQAGAFLILSEDEQLTDSVFLFTGIDKARMRKPVVPGDRLDLHCGLIRNKMKLWKISGTARVDGQLAAEAELTAAIVPREGLQ